METIGKILNDFATEKIPLILKKYSSDEYDQILDKRDLDSFSNKWMNVYKSINTQIGDNHFSDDLRERVFKIVLSNTNNSDLASYISDDFGLFLDATVIDFNDEWLNSLWIVYSKNQIPYENIGKVEGNLKDLIYSI